MGFYLHLSMPLKELSLGWQKNFVCAVEQEEKLQRAIIQCIVVEKYL